MAGRAPGPFAPTGKPSELKSYLDGVMAAAKASGEAFSPSHTPVRTLPHLQVAAPGGGVFVPFASEWSYRLDAPSGECIHEGDDHALGPLLAPGDYGAAIEYGYAVMVALVPAKPGQVAIPATSFRVSSQLGASLCSP